MGGTNANRGVRKMSVLRKPFRRKLPLQKRMGGDVPNQFAKKANAAMRNTGGGLRHKHSLLDDGAEVLYRLRGKGYPLAIVEPNDKKDTGCCTIFFTEKDYKERTYGKMFDPIYLMSGNNYLLMPYIYCKPITSVTTVEKVTVKFEER
jgi:hypothetical protein